MSVTACPSLSPYVRNYRIRAQAAKIEVVIADGSLDPRLELLTAYSALGAFAKNLDGRVEQVGVAAEKVRKV